jgi:hypothetical protein
MRSILLSVALALACGSAFAQAVIEAVQFPAWIERDGSAPIPATPGMELRARDQVRTGGNSRVLLRLPEGSSVKLGENARYSIQAQRREGNVYTAAMAVLEGAFRFTTDTFGRGRARRDISINFVTVTAGIRGTDVWGKSAPDREIVCLLEGMVEVGRGSDKPLLLNQPLQFYIAPKDKPAEPVGIVSEQQIREWAAETEIEAGKGASRRGGIWKVRLATVDTPDEALRLYDAVRAAGYPARILPADVDGKHVYQVRLIQLPSRVEAQALANTVKGRYGVNEPAVTR